MVSVSSSNCGCNQEFAKHPRSYIRAVLAILPCDSYTSLVLSNLLHASIAQQTHARHELIMKVNVIASNVHENSTSTQYCSSFLSSED